MTKVGSETCSDRCAEERARRVSTARTYRYVLYGTIALLVILLLSSYIR